MGHQYNLLDLNCSTSAKLLIDDMSQRPVLDVPVRHRQNRQRLKN